MEQSPYTIEIKTVPSENYFSSTTPPSAGKMYLKKKLLSTAQVPYAIELKNQYDGYSSLILPPMDLLSEAYNAVRTNIKKRDSFDTNQLVAAFVEAKFCHSYYEAIGSSYARCIAEHCKTFAEELGNCIDPENVKAIETNLNDAYSKVFLS